MVHIGSAVVVDRARSVTALIDRDIPPAHSVLVVRDDDRNDDFLDSICEFLDIGVEHVTSGEDIGPMLRGLRPMAVIADLDGKAQDGCHVLKMAAAYDKTLPVLLFSSNETMMLGAVDAVSEVWGMTRVMTGMGGVGEVVDFICHAARNAGRPRMIRV
jgi:CheY-like chemotaxis protein